MMRWLDALGGLKWPSLLLITSPLAAYPFWLPAPAPAVECGTAMVHGQAFRIFQAADGSVMLRPATDAPTAPPELTLRMPVSVDSGGMMVDPNEPDLATLPCLIAARTDD